MPKGKKPVRKRYVTGHIACPHCGGELYIWVHASKSKRRGIRRGPKLAE